MSLKPLFYQIQDLGRYMKSSKKKYIWRYEISAKEHKIELEYSLLSGKRKIIQDDKVLFEGNQVLGAAFQFPFIVDGNNLNIIQQGESFELRINNQVFSHLWQREKNKNEFQYEDDVGKESNNEEKNWKRDSSFASEKINEETNNEKKLKFSVTLNFGKKLDENKFSASPNTNDLKMSKSIAVSNEFSDFSKIDNFKYGSADFDFNSFDFKKFGKEEKKSFEQIKNEKPEEKFPQTDFSSLGKFSIAPLKKPSIKTTSNNNKPIIDLLDLGEELPQKNENETVNPIVAWDPFFDNNTSPQIKEINSSSKNIIVGSQQNETKNQPELYDLIYTDKIPQQEEKGNTIMDMQDVFVDPKVKEAEERFKKMTLLDNAFGSSYSAPKNPNQNFNSNMMNYYPYSQQQSYNANLNINQNFNPANFFLSNSNQNMMGMSQNVMGMDQNVTGMGARLNQAGISMQASNNNINNVPFTPFDQFK